MLSQGALAPPPPPPGYEQHNFMAPQNAPPPPPSTSAPAPMTPQYPPAPMLPAPPPASPPPPQYQQQPVTPDNADRQVKVVQAVRKELYDKLKKVMRSIYTFRTVVGNPESGAHLRRIHNLGPLCSDLLGLHRHFPQSRFSPSHSDKVIRDRSYEAVEYRHFGDFNQRLNGWIKPIGTAVYVDLVFDGRGRRRNHIRAQFTRNGTLDGHFYAYSWDKYGRIWKLQGTMQNILCHDNGLPYTGELSVYGADPTGVSRGLTLQFPLKVMGIAQPQRKEIRHREGMPVSIGN
jgi:hypothetical protein